ncbi:MAG: SRPBCC family protein [Planctomycetota bacterium]
MAQTSIDRIEKAKLLHTPKSGVWRALTDTTEFGSWFEVKLDGEFAPGRTVKGRITHPGYEHVEFEVKVEKMEPGRLFSFHWHPYAVDPKVDYSSEPMTLVAFRLEDHQGGTRLTLMESGFDHIPAARREEAFRMNSQGWDAQMKNIERHLAK